MAHAVDMMKQATKQHWRGKLSSTNLVTSLTGRILTLATIDTDGNVKLLYADKAILLDYPCEGTTLIRSVCQFVF